MEVQHFNIGIHWGESFLESWIPICDLEVQCVNVEIQEPKILRDSFLESWTLILKLNASISQYITIQDIYIYTYIHHMSYSLNS